MSIFGTFNSSEPSPEEVLVTKNEHFPSMDSLHSLDFEKLCDIKQGYLLRKVGDMTLSPVFGVINKESLSLYENDNVNSLITSYPLPELYMSTLDIHSNSPLAQSPLVKCFQILQTGEIMETLCLENNQARQDWQQAVLQFSKCSVEESASNK